MFKRGRNDGSRQVSLPEERKALAERYTIDAEEAEGRTERAGVDHARRDEVAAQAQRVIEERERRERAKAKAKQHSAEEPAPAHEEVTLRLVPEPEPVPEPEVEAVESVAAAAQAVVEQPVVEPVVEAPVVEAPARQEAPPAPPPMTEHEPDPDPEPAPEPDETTEDLPLYGWLQKVDPGSPDTAEWARAMVASKEALSDARRPA